MKSERSKEQRLQTSLDLLSISHRFVFDAIFQHVLEEVESDRLAIPAIQCFSLGKKYELERWWSAAYKSLVDRATPLTVHEVEVLGPDTVVEYIKDREAVCGARLQAELEKETKKSEVRLQAELEKETEKYGARLQAEKEKETEKYEALLQAELKKEIVKYEARLQAELKRERAEKLREVRPFGG